MTKKYNVIIIDDEPLAIDVIRHYLEVYPSYKVLASFTDPKNAFTYLQKNRVDLVFTDIAMPHISGMDLVKSIGDSSKFIMTTSYSEYAIESFELNVVDYLLKPIAIDRFAKSLEYFEARGSTSNRNEATFFVKDGDEYIKVVVDDIDYIEGMKDYAKIVCGNRHYMVLKTLKSIAEYLRPYEFQRVHKSFVVPLRKVNQYNSRCVLIGEHEVPVGSSYKEGLKSYLNSRKM